MKVVFSRGTAEILEMCGRSLFGKINRVRILESGEIYACMEIDCSIISTEERAKLNKEIDILPCLVHKHVVRYLESAHDEEAKMSYLLMEHFTVGDLADVIRSYRREHTRISEDRIWRIFAQLLIAIEYCHSVKKPNAITVGSIVHRNVIPSNVFVGENDIIKLGYFSLHQILGSGSFIRDAESPFYTAPEILQQLPYTEKADIWSLGCIIYELCALQRPFIELDGASLIDVILHNGYTAVSNDYSQELRDAIDSMLNIDPNDRPTAATLLGHPKFGAIGVHKDMLDAQNSDIDMLISTIKERDISLKSATNEINELHRQIDALRKEVGDVESINSCTEQQLQMVKEALENVEKDKEKFVDLYEKETIANKENQLKIQEQIEQIDSLAGTLESLNGVLISHEEEIKILNKKLDDKERHTDNLERRINALLTDKNAQQADIANFECLLASKDAELKTLKDELDALKCHSSALEEKKEKMDLEIERLSNHAARIPEQKMQIEVLSNKVLYLEENAALGERNLCEANQCIATLSSELSKIRQHSTEIESELAIVRKEYAALNEKHNAALNKESYLSAKLDSQESLIADQKAQLREWSFLISELKEKLHLSNSQLNNKVTECSNKTAEITKLSDMISTLNAKLDQTSLELCDLRLTNQTILQENAEHTVALEKTEKQLELEKSKSALRSYGKIKPKYVANRYKEYTQIPKLSIRSSPGDTPLMIAITKNQPLDGLLKYTGIQDRYGCTALMRAAYYNNVPAVRLLVASEGGMRDTDGNTALMYAVERENYVCVSLLVTIEARSLTNKGLSALMRAAHNGSPKIIELLCGLEGGLATPEGLTALMLAALAEDAASICFLLKREGGMTLTDGTTAMLMATSTGNMSVVRALFYSEGRTRDSLGRTPLMVAAEMGHLEAARFLAPTQTGAVTTDGDTALIVASSRGHTEIVQILYYREAGIARPDGWTAMMYAASFGYSSIVEILLRREGKLRTNRGWTALMSAVANNHFETVRLLAPIEGAIKDDFGKTALDQAKELNDSEMVAFLTTFLV